MKWKITALLVLILAATALLSSCGGAATLAHAESTGTTTPLAVLTGTCAEMPPFGGGSDNWLFGLGRNDDPHCSNGQISSNFGIPMPRAGSVVGLRVASSPGPTSGSGDVTVVINDTPTTVHCAVGTTTDCSGTGNQSFPAGAIVGARMHVNGSEFYSNVRVSVLVQF